MSNFDIDEFCAHLNYKLDFLFDGNSWSTNELCNRLMTAFGEVVDQFTLKRKKRHLVKKKSLG